MRDRVAERLGWVRRPIEYPPADTVPLSDVQERLESQGHAALLKRIKGD
jgi:hypothetical protein